MIALLPQISATGACPNPGGGICAAPAGAAVETGSDAAAEFASLLASLAGEAASAGMCAPAETPAAARPQRGHAREKEDKGEADPGPALAAPAAIPVPPPAPAPPPEGVFDPSVAEPAVVEAASTDTPNAAGFIEQAAMGAPGGQPAAPAQAITPLPDEVAATAPKQAPAPEVQPGPPRIFEPAPAPPPPEAPLPKGNGQERRELAFQVKLDDSGTATPDRTVATTPAPHEPATGQPRWGRDAEVEPRSGRLQSQNSAPDLPAKAAAVPPRAPAQLEPKSADVPARAEQASVGQPATTPARDVTAADAPPRPEQASAGRPAPTRTTALPEGPAQDRDFREQGEQRGRDRVEQTAAPHPAPNPHEEAAPSAPRSPQAPAQPNPAPAVAEAGWPTPVRESAAPPRAEAPRPPEPRVIEEPAPAAARQPLRDLSLVVPDRRGETRSAGDVELRISERGGRVQVAVHTADPSLKDSLREHLPELVSRLEETGYRPQVWRPDAAAESLRGPAAAAQEAAGREFGDRSGRNPSGGSEGGQPGNPEQRDRRQDQRNPHPRWIEALEDNLDEQSARSFSYVR